jgi:hypothetical protein
VERLKLHLLQKFGEFLLGSDFVEVKVISLLMDDPFAYVPLLNLSNPLPLLADDSQLFVRPPHCSSEVFHCTIFDYKQ